MTQHRQRVIYTNHQCGNNHLNPKFLKFFHKNHQQNLKQHQDHESVIPQPGRAGDQIRWHHYDLSKCNQCSCKPILAKMENS